MALATDADAISVTNTKLAGDWSGGRFLQSFHNVDDFARVVSVFPKLEPLVKVRLLLACALAPSSDRGKHHAELQRLADQAAADEDEWVRIMSTTASGFSGALNWDAVLDKFPLVAGSMTNLTSKLDSSDSKAFLPALEEEYMQPSSSAPAVPSTKQHSHFTLRKPQAAASGQPGTGIESAAAAATAAASAGAAGAGKQQRPNSGVMPKMAAGRRAAGSDASDIFLRLSKPSSKPTAARPGGPSRGLTPAAQALLAKAEAEKQARSSRMAAGGQPGAGGAAAAAGQPDGQQIKRPRMTGPPQPGQAAPLQQQHQQGHMGHNSGAGDDDNVEEL